MPHKKPHGWSGVPPSRDFAASLKMLSEQLQLKYSQIIAEPMPEEIYSLLKSYNERAIGTKPHRDRDCWRKPAMLALCADVSLNNSHGPNYIASPI